MGYPIQKSVFLLSVIFRPSQIMAVFSGDLVSARMLGQLAVIVNNEKTAHELLNRRAQIYSDRPDLAFYKLYIVILGFGDLLTNFLNYI